MKVAQGILGHSGIAITMDLYATCSGDA